MAFGDGDGDGVGDDHSRSHLSDYASISTSGDCVTDALPKEGFARPCSGREHARKRWITVEVIVALIAASFGGLATLQAQYIRMRVSRDLANGTHLNSNGSLCDEGNATVALQNEIQRVTSHWTLYLASASTFLGIFSTLILGTLSERYGRRLAIVLPCLGFLAQSVVCLCVVYLDLPLAFFFIGSVATGVTGGLSLFMASCFAYISDITTEKQRMVRIVIVELLIFAGIGAIQMGQGYMIRDLGFASSIWVPFAATIVSVINGTSTYLLIETVCPDTKCGVHHALKSIVRDIGHLLTVKTDNRQWILLAFLLIGLLINIVIQGSISITVLYGQGQPFCWRSVTIGFYTTVSLLLPGIGCVSGAGFFSWRKLGYLWVIQIGSVSCLANTLAVAMSFIWQYTELLFASTFLGIFKLLGAPVIRTFLSTIVERSEHGALFASLGVMDSLAMFVAPVLLNGLYASTVDVLSTAVFFFMSALMVVPILGIGIMQCTGVVDKKSNERPLLVNTEEDDQQALISD